MSLILVTGATDGIGLETAIQLARQGHALLMHGRNAARAQQALDTVQKLVPQAELHTLHADLSDLVQVAEMANELRLRLTHLDVLINNAGVYMNQRKLIVDGLEMTLAVNHLAHFLLTLLLLPLLKKSAEARVVTVSSVAHMSGRIEFDNLNGERRFDAYQAYANSKLANALFAMELARREPWLSSNSLHPGVIDTKLLHAGFDMQGASRQSGALTSIYLASSPDVTGSSGKYYDDCRSSAPLATVNDEALAKKLWAWSEQAVSRFL